MGRKVAIVWHALSWMAAGALYFFFAIPAGMSSWANCRTRSGRRGASVVVC